jgi:hypothetical protein
LLTYENIILNDKTFSPIFLESDSDDEEEEKAGKDLEKEVGTDSTNCLNL